jgi:hypothetical protein
MMPRMLIATILALAPTLAFAQEAQPIPIPADTLKANEFGATFQGLPLACILVPLHWQQPNGVELEKEFNAQITAEGYTITLSTSANAGPDESLANTIAFACRARPETMSQ